MIASAIVWTLAVLTIVPSARQAPGVQADVEPLVAVRYRGTPAGRPVQDDLDAYLDSFLHLLRAEPARTGAP